MQELPHSIDDEHCVLAALMHDQSLYADVACILDSTHFYLAQNSLIYSAIVDLVKRKEHVDIFSVHSLTKVDLHQLSKINELYLSRQTSIAQAKRVRENSKKREFIKTLNEYVGLAYRPDASALELTNEIVSNLLRRFGGESERKPLSMFEATEIAYKDLDARSKGKADYITTGFVDLDKLTSGGGRRGELWVVASGTSSGKSSFCLAISRRVSVEHLVLLCTLEDSLINVMHRHVADAGDVSLSDLRNPRQATEDFWVRACEGIRKISGLSMYTDDQPSITTEDVRRKLRQVNADAGRQTDLLIVDYLQLMVGAGENRNREVGRIAYELQAIAKEFSVWVVLVSQVNRDPRDGPPSMRDLKDSGDIENAARCICLLHRPQVNNHQGSNNVAEINVCKQSNGPTGKVSLYFDGSHQRFENLHDAHTAHTQ